MSINRSQKAMTYTLSKIESFEAEIHFTGVGVINGDDQLLLLFNNKANCYTCPGGKLDPGETVEEAAVREVREEVGIKIEKKDLIPIVFIGIYVNGNFCGNAVQFVAYKWEGEAVNCEPHKHRDFFWFDGVDSSEIDPIVRPVMYNLKTEKPIYYKLELSSF